MLYCPLSGLCPCISDVVGDMDFQQTAPHVEKAWKAIAADKLASTIEMTWIYATDETEALDWVSAEKTLLIPDSHIRAIPFPITDHDWDRDLYQSGGIFYYVDRGADILVASAAINILSLATNGRMTSQRIWRMVIHKPPRWDGFKGIDYYGDISDPRNLGELPIETPGSDYYEAIWQYYPVNPCKIVGGLEALGDSGVIRHKLIWEGKYWVWMNPNCFPLNEDETSHGTTPSFLEPSTSHHALSAIEQLPFEIIVNIASYCPLPSVLCLSSISRHLRSKYLGSSSDRDYFARLWVKTSAPWYEVHLPKDHVCQSAEVACDCQKMGWGYLMRCLASWSMMNRKRIWGIAQQLEREADEIGV